MLPEPRYCPTIRCKCMMQPAACKDSISFSFYHQAARLEPRGLMVKKAGFLSRPGFSEGVLTVDPAMEPAVDRD